MATRQQNWSALKAGGLRHNQRPTEIRYFTSSGDEVAVPGLGAISGADAERHLVPALDFSDGVSVAPTRRPMAMRLERVRDDGLKPSWHRERLGIAICFSPEPWCGTFAGFAGTNIWRLN